ncbi:hypothetical protein DIPPA_53890 [Diplonema papillatum]|nr:hypothetical protein DIPPA_53890 [Diplonema papillatum]
MQRNKQKTMLSGVHSLAGKAIWPVIVVSILVLSFAISSVQLVLALTVRPLNRSLYLELVSPLIWLLASILATSLQWIGGYRVRIYSEQPEEYLAGAKSVIALWNHVNSFDWLVGSYYVALTNQVGNLRSVAKQTLIFLPGLGWIWYLMDFIFLKRSLKEDKTRLQQGVSLIKQANQQKAWPGRHHYHLVLFPEGTRLTDSKLLESQKWQKEQGFSPMKHVMYPKAGGFIQLYEGFGSDLDDVLDVTLVYPPGCTGSIGDLFTGENHEVAMLVRKLDPTALKKAAEGDHLKQLLVDVFQQKDDLIETYRKQGNFGEPHRLRYATRPRMFCHLVSAFFIVLSAQAFLYFALPAILFQFLLASYLVSGLTILLMCSSKVGKQKSA